MAWRAVVACFLFAGCFLLSARCPPLVACGALLASFWLLASAGRECLVREARSLDPMLEFARKPNEASNGGGRDAPPLPHLQRDASRETQTKCIRLLFLNVSLEASLKVVLASLWVVFGSGPLP